VTTAELHGATTHLALVALPLWGVLLVLRRVRPGWALAAALEPWALGAAVVGFVFAGLSGLLARGQAQTTLRGGDLGIGTAHFWLGIALAVVVVVVAAFRLTGSGRGALPLVLAGVLAVVAVGGAVAQGYLGGRMTYRRAVGIDSGGELAQSAAGASEIQVALAQGVSARRVGMEAFSAGGLGCASCHGDHAQGERGPPLAGGRGLDDFRRVHGHGLFPPAMVSAQDFAVVDRYLRSLASPSGDR
jgi:mono/diheme cytochrome c family protein